MEARLRPIADNATALARRSMPGRGVARVGICSGAGISCGAIPPSLLAVGEISRNTASRSTLFRSVDGLNMDPVSSLTGDIGCCLETGIPEVTMIGGDEYRPRRGSELLRRLFASHESS